jgi:ubiquinone/menaquinone biosynthesis C-methylase UbiE
MNANEQLLYALQEKTVLSQRQEMPSMLGHPDCIDAWRQRRMYGLIQPIVAYGIGGRWLTIGDSGSDATTLAESGVAPGRIVASSLCTAQLEQLADRGYIPGVEVRMVNAERIDAPADEFDFVFAKEVYHHLPRPSIGLYEMLRVAREAVVLIEPIDFIGRPLDLLRDLVKTLLRRKLVQGEFEYYGNYTYRMSLRETRKLMTGMAYSDMYVLLFNDFGNNSGAAPVSDRYQMGIHRLAMRVQDLLARTFLMSWGKCVVVLAKKPLAAPLRERLEAAGFRRHLLPKNPYLPADAGVGSGAAAPLPQ